MYKLRELANSKLNCHPSVLLINLDTNHAEITQGEGECNQIILDYSGLFWLNYNTISPFLYFLSISENSNGNAKSCIL